jgi:hypothetical protein
VCGLAVLLMLPGGVHVDVHAPAGDHVWANARAHSPEALGDDQPAAATVFVSRGPRAWLALHARYFRAANEKAPNQTHVTVVVPRPSYILTLACDVQSAVSELDLSALVAACPGSGLLACVRLRFAARGWVAQSVNKLEPLLWPVPVGAVSELPLVAAVTALLVTVMTLLLGCTMWRADSLQQNLQRQPQKRDVGAAQMRPAVARHLDKHFVQK